MKSKFIAGLLIALVLVAFMCTQGLAADYMSPKIWGDYVVAKGYFDLFLCNVNNPGGQINISNDGAVDIGSSDVGISADWVVWNENPMAVGQVHVYAYNISQGIKTCISPINGTRYCSADVFGDEAVFATYDLFDMYAPVDIFLYDLNSGSMQLVCSSSMRVTDIALSNHYLVWQEANGAIIVFDRLANTFTGINNQFPGVNAGHLDLWGPFIVCDVETNQCNGIYQVYIHRIVPGGTNLLSQPCVNNGDNYLSPAVSRLSNGRRVGVWVGSGLTEWGTPTASVYYRVGNSPEVEASGLAPANAPDVFRDKIVFEQCNMNGFEVYLYDISTQTSTLLMYN
ncbi:MAG: hypothetical protein HQ596_01275 [Candidatus Saganbacteria bacterium]|nr:hypothetical protein [Candidatus Saganbacteria bacterium]